ncbi:ABC-three component system protein [Desulforamulus aeronauticus]|uniref:ABC-three component system protein n=1 Tax=Desulforamulus aeronauticus TaxID=53343 RepID=UPI001EE4A965|nr:ABC-three component system protein [Desulforamulus aeronauticus]
MYRELLVKINIQGSKDQGSGCLYQPNSEKFTYVLTAKHCLTKDENKIVFTQEEIKLIIVTRDTGERLEVTSCYVKDNLDLAVLKVKILDDLPAVLAIEPIRNMNFLLKGYPKYLMGYDESCVITGKIIDVSLYDEYFELECSKSLESFDNNAKDNTVGFSGSGVFFELEGDFKLIGILTRLKDPNGTYSRLKAIKVSCINQFLLEMNLEPLIPFELYSFKKYLPESFSNCGKAKVVFEECFSNGVKGITPYNIFESLGEKMFLPYDKENQLLFKDNLWIGWIKLLTHLHIEENSTINISNINDYIYLNETDRKKENKKRFFYTYKFNHLGDCIQHIFVSIYDDIKYGDCIIINSEKRFMSFDLGRDLLEKIVREIDEVELYKNKIDIDNPNAYKNISIYHIDVIEQFLREKKIDFLTIKESKDIIKEELRGVFQNVN